MSPDKEDAEEYKDEDKVINYKEGSEDKSEEIGVIGNNPTTR